MKTKTMLLIANGYVLKAQDSGLVFLYIKNRDEKNVKDRAPSGDFVLYVIRRTKDSWKDHRMLLWDPIFKVLSSVT